MTGESISMREAARVLGVSQLRVRELIRKGTLDAQKVTDEAGEHWTIARASVETYLERRPPRPVAPTDGSGRVFTDLIDGLESQLTRVRSLIDEIAKSHAFLDGLRSAQRSLEAELTETRRRAHEVGTAVADGVAAARRKRKKPEDTDSAQDFARKAVQAAKKAVEAAKTVKPVESDAAETTGEPEPAPKAPAAKAKPKPAPRSAAAKPKAPAKTAMAAALRQAGVSSDKPKATKKK